MIYSNYNDDTKIIPRMDYYFHCRLCDSNFGSGYITHLTQKHTELVSKEIIKRFNDLQYNKVYKYLKSNFDNKFLELDIYNERLYEIYQVIELTSKNVIKEILI